MRWLKRLKASKMNPLGPDFSSAPWINFGLSDKKLRFRCPAHEMSGPFKMYQGAINLYQDSIFEQWDECNTGMSVLLLSTGWKYWDKPLGEGALGYLNINVMLHRRDPHFREIDSMLNQEDMEQWLLTYADGLWGHLNRELVAHPERKVRPISPERDFWRYPKEAKEIKKTVINDLQWFSYVVDTLNDSKKRRWHTPITEDHELAILFNPSALGRDYYEPEHDLDNAIECTIKEFIENVHIKLD
ncbi:hypothetical protein O5O45_26960 [Hahella aquimaris]|uniref:hypothetical protein n=1 Tax=Hahella sp. HNIBRBA332 TaxID=3015983 RepID=UPI00273BCDBF|nr:hypothetical protein [Hahella sp. HNIBRBA332]WLQ13369.1 hypothetical protein O5O45_26960 [Hahella sp. HNIBRBA332]